MYEVWKPKWIFAGRSLLESTRDSLIQRNPGAADARLFVTLNNLIDNGELVLALKELEALCVRFGDDHNLWRALSSCAHFLGLLDDEEKYRIACDRDYASKAIQMPQECRGLPILRLDSMNQASLIILARSGFVYWNQTCGVGCGQRGEEGVLVPLVDFYGTSLPVRRNALCL